MNKKGFTLIELLVVVAIIGILAAVGVVAYNGYTNSAKKSSAKSNHSSIVKFMSAEIQKCNLGERTAMSGQLSCPITNSSRCSLICFGFNKLILLELNFSVLLSLLTMT